MSKSLVEKISRIQSALKAPKSQYNKFGNYPYRNQEDILEAVKPLLAKEGLIQTITDDVVLVGNRIYVKATVVVSDGEAFVTVSSFAREPQEQKGMSEPQITGSASSYARKYALNGMYAIDDTKDADATNDHGKAAPAADKPKVEASTTGAVAGAAKTDTKPAGRFAPKAAAKAPPVAADTTDSNSSDDGWS